MLVLTRRADESIVIRDDIVVTVLAVDGDKVKLGISAPRDARILRQELYQAVQEQNLAAARRGAATTPDALHALNSLLSAGPNSGTPEGSG